MYIPFSSTHFKWEKSELEALVTSGVFTKNAEVTEHVALHPFWLSNPMQGITEDFDKALARWRPRLSGYLVAYEDVRREGNKAAMMNVDQPWLHLDVRATFYVYKPAVGQVIQGVVKRIGDTAAICLVFNCFPVTVDPSSLDELYTWYSGTELEVQITSFENRRKSPIIRARCLKVLPSTQQSYSNSYTWENGEHSGDLNDSVDTPNTNRSKNIVLNISVPKSMKTKKNTIIRFSDDDDEEAELSAPPQPEPQVSSKKDKPAPKSKKRKHAEPEPEEEPITQKEPKRKKKRSLEPEELPPIQVQSKVKTPKIKKERNKTNL